MAFKPDIRELRVGDRFWLYPMGLSSRRAPLVVVAVYGDGHFVATVDPTRALPDDYPGAPGYHMAFEKAEAQVEGLGKITTHWSQGMPFAFGEFEGEVACLPLMAILGPDLFSPGTR